MFKKHKNLDDAYLYVCKTLSDIYLHCPTLKQLASECNHVTEMGSRYGVSTIALMSGAPQHLIAYDIDERAIETLTKNIAPLAPEGTVFEAKLGDSCQIEIAPTDMLFIDTFHVYAVLSAELKRHHKNVSKYIICHDTTGFQDQGENGSTPGIRSAVIDFIKKDNPWSIKREYRYNNGLMVLKRD